MKPASSEECLAAQARASVGFEETLKKVLSARTTGEAQDIYKMLMYFMGFLDEDFKDLPPGFGGKRFRPALCLFLSEAYGVREKAEHAALAIELFHNFTLIHDDVEDRDEMRRNRPTVWKLWGVNHAINSGDALLLLATESLLQTGPKLGGVILRSFEEVAQGQYLDFELAEKQLGSDAVREERALLVNEKKTAALIGAAAEVAGILGGQSEDECKNLRAYGMALGMLFQLADDYRSVWETQKETGKDSHSDIREHKRTVPFFAAQKELEGSAKKRLEELYSLTRQLSEAEVAEALAVVNSTKAKEYVFEKIKEYAAESRALAEKLSVPDESKSILIGLVEMLVPEISK